MKFLMIGALALCINQAHSVEFALNAAIEESNIENVQTIVQKNDDSYSLLDKSTHLAIDVIIKRKLTTPLIQWYI